MLLQNQLCAIILAFFAVYVIWSNPASLTWKFHLGTLKSNFHPGWGKGHLSPLSLCLGCILKVIAKGPAAYHLQTGSEHKSRDPSLRTKSNFAVVRSLGKARRVQSGPPKPIRRQLPALRQRRVRAGGSSRRDGAPPAPHPGAPPGRGGHAQGCEPRSASARKIMGLCCCRSHSWRLLRNDGFFFSSSPPPLLCTPRGPFVGPNRPIQVTHCRQRWK